MTVPLWVRRLIRPFIPDRFMARFRLHQHSRQVRHNVDILAVGTPARRWLATTPDTYRARPPSAYRPRPELAEALAALGPASGPHHIEAHDLVVLADGPFDAAATALMLADPDIAAVVCADAAPPPLVGRRRTEPALGPRAAAVRRTAWEDVAGAPDAPRPLPGLVARLKDAGHRIGLVPLPPRDAPTRRDDPIDAAAVVILAAVPLHDVGGGSRAAQLAQELLARGYHVTFAPLFGVAESTDLGLRFVHPRLEQVRATDLAPAAHAARVRSGPRIAIVELPAAALLDHVRDLRRAGFTIVYEAIDDWTDPALGGEWFRPDAEREMVGLADVTVASAPDLARRLRDLGAEPVLAPNGVNRALFSRDQGPVPDDFPAGSGPVLGYHGSLYGPWFDWAALADVATADPDARVVVIGDAGHGHPELPGNVYFLGLKPQSSLPDYVTRFDVGLIPFTVNEATHAVSPLKVYEYLASGVPVAAAPLRALEGLDGVHVGPPLAAAVAAALAAPRPDAAAVLAEHSWGARLAAIFAAAGQTLASEEGIRARIEQRPVTHWTKEQRRT